MSLVNNAYLQHFLSFPPPIRSRVNSTRESRFFSGFDRIWIPASAGMTGGEYIIHHILLLLATALLIPSLALANGGDQRIVDNLYLINLSRAPFTPRVGVQTSFLASFVDIKKNTLVAEDLIINIRIAKLGGAGTAKRDFIFRKDAITVKGGILELPYMFAEPGLHEIFFDFAFAENPQKAYGAPDFLIDVQSQSSLQTQNKIIFWIISGTLCGFMIGWLIGWFMRRHYI